jgi:hypothetical protein
MRTFMQGQGEWGEIVDKTHRKGCQARRQSQWREKNA